MIQTLNRNHGYIDFSLPPTLNAMGIDKKLLNYIEQSSYPKSELKQLEYKNQPIAFELRHHINQYLYRKNVVLIIIALISTNTDIFNFIMM